MAQTVTGPDGKTWTIRRRWYPWRRALSLRSAWHSTPDSDAKAEPPAADAPEAAKPEESGNPVLNIIIGAIALLVWLVIKAGKAVLIVLAVLLVVILSVADLVLQLLVMPFVLLARALGAMRWPVQVDREHQFVKTEFASGFDDAAALRDDLAGRIQRGELVADPVTS